MTKLPEDDVADRILDEVRAAALLEDSDIPKLRDLLLSGVSRPEDWRFAIESSIAKRKTGAKASTSKAGRRGK
jgi:hypothetical protein